MLRKKIKNLGLNKVRLSLKGHLSINISVYTLKGFYIDMKIEKSQKRKAFWLFTFFFMEFEVLYMDKITR